jgi:uncharacterized protein YciI
MPLIPDMHNMFVVDLHYVAPLDRIDALIPEHGEFLKRNYDAGVFIASGRKVPRTGGVIIAVSDSKDRLEAILREDPFHQNGLAQYSVTEFQPAMRAAALDS